MAKLIALITDFGSQGPYVGQLKAVLATEAPNIPVIDLLSNAPVVRPKASAYLVAALAEQMPVETLFLTVIDPGVGGERQGLVLETDRFWFVGPDNGSLALAARRSNECRLWSINWQPPKLSASFHGRDLFAPVAARIARGDAVPGVPMIFLIASMSIGTAMFLLACVQILLIERSCWRSRDIDLAMPAPLVKYLPVQPFGMRTHVAWLRLP